MSDNTIKQTIICSEACGQQWIGHLWPVVPQNTMFCAIIVTSNLRNVNLNPNSLWGIFQNGPAQDVGKAAVKQPQKPQTRGLFSDDEDVQVKLSSFTGKS